MRRLLSSLGLRSRREARLRQEIDEEIRAHLAMCEADLIARGLSRAEARAAAARRFGDVSRAPQQLYASARRAEGRASWGAWVDSMRQDFRLAARAARAAPAFALLTVATFAVGIGLTTVVFTILDHAVIRPLPFPEPDRLVALDSVGASGVPFAQVSAANWIDWKEHNQTLESSAIYAARRMSVATDDRSLRVTGARVGGPFFAVLQAPMVVGRGFTEAEAQDGEPRVVISEGFWRRVLGSELPLPELIVAGTRVAVVGVLADDLAFPQRTEVWLPYTYYRRTGRLRNNINWYAVARLNRGVSIAEARADLSRVARTIAESDPEGIYSHGVGVEALRSRVVGDAGRTLAILMGAVISVLLVACANLAGQAYARSAAAMHGSAVRIALGASRGRVIQQQLVEHVVLAIAGGMLGVGLAVWATRLATAGGLPIPRAPEIHIDLRILTFALAVSLLAGLLAGLVPAFKISRAAPREAMGPGRGSVAGGRRLQGGLLIGAEVAVSVVLLIGGGLLIRSFVTLVARDIGFDPGDIIVADIALRGDRYDAEPEARIDYWRALEDRLQRLPGVETVAVANVFPTGVGGGNGFIQLDGHEETASANYRVISEAYFELLRIPILAGRTFGVTDAAGTERVTIVNQRFVDTYWPGQNPIGRRVRALSMEPGSGWLTVVGVVGDIRQGGFATRTRPDMYVLHRQVPDRLQGMTAAIRTSAGATARMQREVAEAVRALDPEIAADLATLESRLNGLVTAQRLVTSVLVLFASVALGLAAIGLHGLLSFSVSRRTHEIAVRSALGAQRSRILVAMLVEVARLALAATALGLVVAWWAAQLMASLLIETEPRDPLTFGVVAATLVAVSLLAAARPAWRAASLDPVEALRTS